LEILLNCNETPMHSAVYFQNVVLGGGEAGKYIAWELARQGQRVAVIEKE
jgi:pyruvate/2-oxoglutarate dehydrogenase complex dihydrolipoamide dehydrogenase (E3) component